MPAPAAKAIGALLQEVLKASGGHGKQLLPSAQKPISRSSVLLLVVRRILPSHGADPNMLSNTSYSCFE